jgi:hypothetical protein
MVFIREAQAPAAGLKRALPGIGISLSCAKIMAAQNFWGEPDP